jgi:hypothetical protein
MQKSPQGREAKLMALLLAFAPFIVFAAVDRLAGSMAGLIAGAAVSIVILLRDFVTSGRSPKILEVGTALLFSGLALYTFFGVPGWSIMDVRLRVDLGLLVIVLISLAVRRPFTLQYARERVPREIWDSPEFFRTNFTITAVWALAFLAMVVADLILVYKPDMPAKVGIIITIVALVGAFKFTAWYPEKVRAKRSAPKNGLTE